MFLGYSSLIVLKLFPDASMKDKFGSPGSTASTGARRETTQASNEEKAETEEAETEGEKAETEDAEIEGEKAETEEEAETETEKTEPSTPKKPSTQETPSKPVTRPKQRAKKSGNAKETQAKSADPADSEADEDHSELIGVVRHSMVQQSELRLRHGKERTTIVDTNEWMKKREAAHAANPDGKVPVPSYVKEFKGWCKELEAAGF